MESMLDIDGKVVRVGDRVAFVTTGYSHNVNFRVGIVSKIRPGYNGRGAATVSYLKPVRYGSDSVKEVKSVMQLPRIAKIG